MKDSFILIFGLAIIAYFPSMFCICFGLNYVPESSVFYKPFVVALALGFFSFLPLILTFFTLIDIKELEDWD